MVAPGAADAPLRPVRGGHALADRPPARRRTRGTSPYISTIQILHLMDFVPGGGVTGKTILYLDLACLLRA